MVPLDAITKAWGWAGLKPVEIVGQNAFGNIIFKDAAGAYWRICPEDAECTKIAHDGAGYLRLINDPEFTRDWEMLELVKIARQNLGPLKPDHCYYLAVPSVLGGKYDVDNIQTASLTEVTELSGSIARQIKELPDGAAVELKVVD